MRKINKNCNYIKFCDATIKGKIDEKNLNKFTFYLRKEHSNNCKLLLENEFNSICNSNNINDILLDHQYQNKKEAKNINNDKDININKKYIYSINELENIMKNYILDNKNNKLRLKILLIMANLLKIYHDIKF